MNTELFASRLIGPGNVRLKTNGGALVMLIWFLTSSGLTAFVTTMSGVKSIMPSVPISRIRLIQRMSSIFLFAVVMGVWLGVKNVSPSLGIEELIGKGGGKTRVKH